MICLCSINDFKLSIREKEPLLLITMCVKYFILKHYLPAVKTAKERKHISSHFICYRISLNYKNNTEPAIHDCLLSAALLGIPYSNI